MEIVIAYLHFIYMVQMSNKFSSIEEIRVSNSFLNKQIIVYKVFEKLLTQFRLNILHLTYWELNFILTIIRLIIMWEHVLNMYE